MKLTIASALPIVFLANTYLCGQNQGVLQINSDIVVHFIVTDPQGRQTGADPRGANKPWIGTQVGEIPGANYSASGVGDNPMNVDFQESDNSREFLYGLRSPENDGVYRIDCIGWKLRRFSLYVDVTPEDSTSMQSFRTAVSGVVDKDNVVSYRFEYHGHPGASIRFEKMVSSSTLRQDLNNSYKLKLLGDKELHRDLSHRLDKFEKELARKDSSEAREELKKFGEKIEEVRKETLKREQKKQKPPKHFITTDAYQILDEDVDALLRQLPAKRKGKKDKDDDRKDDDREGRRDGK